MDVPLLDFLGHHECLYGVLCVGAGTEFLSLGLWLAAEADRVCESGVAVWDQESDGLELWGVGRVGGGCDGGVGAELFCVEEEGEEAEGEGGGEGWWWEGKESAVGREGTGGCEADESVWKGGCEVM